MFVVKTPFMNRLLFFILLSASMPCFSQTVITGTVKDNKGRSFPGASISIKDSYDGATADSLGNFRFRTTESGEKLLVVSAIGFKTVELNISLSGSSIHIPVVLKENPNELTAVVITAGSFEASDTKRTTVLSSLDIATTASANADVTSAIKTLPGAQQVGESEGLFVRGGTADETKVFIDGTRVNNFFFSSVPDLAQRGRFSPFLFKGTVFSSGGYSALYGQALSAAVILESIDFPDRTSATAGISTVGLNAGYQHLAKDKQSSWGVSYNFTHLGAYYAVIPQGPDNYKTPVFHNGDINFRIKTSKTGMLKFYGYFNFSDLGIRRPDIDSSELRDQFSMYNGNVYANLSYKEKLSANTRLSIGSSYSNNLDRIDQQLVNGTGSPANIGEEPLASKTFHVDAVAEAFAIKPVIERRLGALSAIRAGAEFISTRNRNDFSNQSIQNLRLNANENYLSGFAESDIYITNDLAAKAGLRWERSSLINSSNIAPRLSLAYRLGLKGQASFAYGIFYQQPDEDLYLRGFKFPSPKFQKATHYIANYQYVNRNYTLRGEIFTKQYDRLIKTISANNGMGPDSAMNNGGGYAKGIELFWRDKRTFKGVDYWVSYSFLDTKRDHLNFPGSMEPSFASRHTFNLVLKKFVTKMKTQFNASYTYASGRPYYNIRFQDNKIEVADQGRTIPYQNLSISINYLPFLEKQTLNSFTVFVFSVNNVLGSKQVFGYNYSANGLNKQPILPPARTFYFFGCFLSFGVDRTDEIINNNL